MSLSSVSVDGPPSLCSDPRPPSGRWCTKDNPACCVPIPSAPERSRHWGVGRVSRACDSFCSSLCVDMSDLGQQIVNKSSPAEARKNSEVADTGVVGRPRWDHEADERAAGVPGDSPIGTVAWQAKVEVQIVRSLFCRTQTFKLSPRMNIQAALRNVTKQGQELLVRRWCERQASAASRPRCARRPLEAQSLDALGQSCGRRSGVAPSHRGDRCRFCSPIGRYVDIEIRKSELLPRPAQRARHKAIWQQSLQGVRQKPPPTDSRAPREIDNLRGPTTEPEQAIAQCLQGSNSKEGGTCVRRARVETYPLRLLTRDRSDRTT